MEYLGFFLVIIGGIFCTIGSIGFTKMPDLYTRMHAAGISDSCGCLLTILGITCFSGFSIITLKLLLLLAILLIMNATSTNILVRAAVAKDIKPILGNIKKNND